MKRQLVPIVLALVVLIGLLIYWQSDRSSGDQSRGEKPHVGAGQSPPQAAVKSETAPKPPRPLTPPSPLSKAEDFPHNLKTFRDWGSISAREMETYRVSLIARVGLWEASEVEEFFFRSAPEIDAAALRSFRESILGVWCAKDVSHCLAQLDERVESAEVPEMKQDALAGWAREDWLTALRYLQKTGDRAIESQLGGDSTRFVKHLISEVARANGIDEAAEVAGFLRTANNRTAASAAIEDVRAELK